MKLPLHSRACVYAYVLTQKDIQSAYGSMGIHTCEDSVHTFMYVGAHMSPDCPSTTDTCAQSACTHPHKCASIHTHTCTSMQAQTHMLAGPVHSSPLPLIKQNSELITM